MSRLWVQTILRNGPENNTVLGTTAPARLLPGTDGATSPFWSPDGSRLGFFADGSLKQVNGDGGAVQVTSAAPDAGGGSWNENGVIIFSEAGRGIFSVPSGGGAPRQLTALDAETQESAHLWPAFLPDSRHFLYTVVNRGEYNRGEFSGVHLGSLTSSEKIRVGNIFSQAAYASGSLMFAQHSLLWASPFSSKTFKFTGPRRLVAQPVRTSASGLAWFTVSQNGGVVVHARSAAQEMWVIDEAGRRIGMVPDAGEYVSPRISPTRDEIAASLFGSGDIYVYQAQTEQWRRITDGLGHSSHPVWAKDGAEIIFASNTPPRAEIEVVRADGTGTAAKVIDVPFNPTWPTYPTSISGDGKLLSLVEYGGRATGLDIRVILTDGKGGLDERTVWQRRSPKDESAAALSRDGQWLAFVTSGTISIVDLSRRNTGADVSLGAGTDPVWSPRGDQLFYRKGSTIVALRTAGEPQTWAASGRIVLDDADLQPAFDVSPDGKRLLVSRRPSSTASHDFEALVACSDKTGARSGR